MLHLMISIVLYLMEVLLRLYLKSHTSNCFLQSTAKVTQLVGPIYKSADFAFALPKNSTLRADMLTAILNIIGGDTIIQFESKWIDHNSHQNDGPPDGSGIINFESCGGLFLITGVVTTGFLLVAMLMNCYKKHRQNARDKGDDQNECGHGQEKENMEEQGDQNNDGEGTELIERQTTLSVPHNSNGDDDQLPDSRCSHPK